MSQFIVKCIDDECYVAKTKQYLYHVYWDGFKKPTWEPTQVVQHLDLYELFINDSSHWKNAKIGQECLYYARTKYQRRKGLKLSRSKGKSILEWVNAIIIKIDKDKRILDVQYYVNAKTRQGNNIAFGSKSIKKVERKALEQKNCDNDGDKNEQKCLDDDISDTDSDEKQILQNIDLHEFDNDISDTNSDTTNILLNANHDTID